MGTHPIFESYFDCLTEMGRVDEICFEAPEISMSSDITIDATLSIVTVSKLTNLNVDANCYCPGKDFKPENSIPEDPEPEDPEPEEPKPEDPNPEDPKQEDPKPEVSKPENSKPKDLKQEDPIPEDPKQEDPKPEDPKQEDPAPTNQT